MLARALTLGLTCTLGVLLATTGCEDDRIGYVPGAYDQIDTYEQKSAAKVDILWVVDNSGTMVDEQQALADNFERFMFFLTSSLVDFHIGVVAVDVADPQFSGKLHGDPRYITPDTADPTASFRGNVMLGAATTRLVLEKGLEASKMALDPAYGLVNGYNDGFLRDDASLVVIFVSDEDDHSFGEVWHYVRFIEGLKGPGNENLVSASAIVGFDEEPLGESTRGCQAVNSAGTTVSVAEYGERYVKVAEQTGGITVNICDLDFVSSLQRLGLTAAGLQRKFPLSKSPDLRDCQDSGGYGAFASCISVEIVSADDTATPVAEDRNDGWAYDMTSNSIFFDGTLVPMPNEEVHISYKVMPETN